MPYYVNRIQNGNELYHHGILGQKWGVRRFQNSDGSRTAAGKKRYGGDSVQLRNVKKAYSIKENANKLRPDFENMEKCRKALNKHNEEFAKTIGTKSFEEYFEKGLQTYVGDDELQDLVRFELDEWINGESTYPSPRYLDGYNWAYEAYTENNPTYRALYKKYSDSCNNYYSKAENAAKKEYSKVGNGPLKHWAGNEYTENERRDVEIIKSLIIEESEKRYGYARGF